MTQPNFLFALEDGPVKCTMLLTLAVLAAGQTVEARELVKSPREYLIARPTGPITIDGQLREWDMKKAPYVISPSGKDPMSGVLSVEPTNPVAGDADLSGRVRVAWDERYLYVAGEMVDDHLRGIKAGSRGNEGPPGWGCDCLMVMLASFRQPMKPNSPYHESPIVGLRYTLGGAAGRGKLVGADHRVNPHHGLYWVLPKNAKLAVVETEQGYNVEAAIAWKDLGFVARSGEKLFVSFLAADVDPDEPLNQIGWGFAEEVKSRPVFRLADRSDLTGMLTVSANELPLNKAWGVRAELDARAGVAMLESVRVVDAGGNVVARRPIRFSVPTGKTGRAVVDFKPGEVSKEGVHTVEMLAQVAEEAPVVVAKAVVRVVEAEAPRPMIRNAAGEIHHMSPERVAHHAYDQHYRKWYRYSFVKGKADYVPYIRKWVEPNLKAVSRAEIKRKFRGGWRQAQRCMALAQITGDKEYVDLARQIMDYLLDTGTREPRWFQFTAITMYRYLTWKKDPNSPFAPKDAEKRYRQGLHFVAANPTDYFFNESGTHNRVWHRYAGLKVARMVAEQDGKPVDPRVIEYTDYHDQLIGKVGDSDDATANYHWVFMDAALGIYFHTGDWQAFVEHPGFTKTFDRYVEMASPSGACPQFASCSGWHQPHESMWAYEWMSRVSRNGRYRWTSHRIAEYYYNHLNWIANQYHMPFDAAKDQFVLSYLLADDAVKPVPSPSTSRVTWRHPTEKVPLEKLRQRPGTSSHEMDASRWIPDKVILSSGNKPTGLWGMIELLPSGGHAGEVPGNIIALTQYDAGLLIGQGYYDNSPPLQNLLWVEDLDGLATDPRPMTTTVPIFVDDPALTFVRIRTTAYQHLPVTYTRDILFYKNGFLIVKDRVKFDTSMKVRLGPCYQTRSLGPECGPNWFNTYYEQLYHTGLGLGGGVQAIKNPAWDLLVYFTPRQDRKHTVLDRYKENPYRCSPIQLRQSWAGMARAGQEFTFTSILLPHVPSQTPSHLLHPPADSKDRKRIEVVTDADNLTVVKLIHEVDPVHKFRYETWVMLNDTGKPATGGPLASDGRVAVVGHHYNGSIQHRVVIGGKTLTYRGADESAKARKRPVRALEMPREYKEWKRP